MNRVVHFEIQVDDIERAKKFYGDVFGWTFDDYSDYVGSAYWGVVTGNEDEKGINGGLVLRSKPNANDSGANAFLCTIDVDSYDETENKILAAGGQIALPKHALPGMAWQGYYLDTENNTFGIHQVDEAAA